MACWTTKKKISNCFISSQWSKQRVISTFGGHPLLIYLMKWIHATSPKKNLNFQLKLCILYKQDYWRFQAVLWRYLVWIVKVQVIMTWTWACTLLLELTQELDCSTNVFTKFGIKNHNHEQILLTQFRFYWGVFGNWAKKFLILKNICQNQNEKVLKNEKTKVKPTPTQSPTIVMASFGFYNNSRFGSWSSFQLSRPQLHWILEKLKLKPNLWT